MDPAADLYRAFAARWVLGYSCALAPATLSKQRGGATAEKQSGTKKRPLLPTITSVDLFF